jgi:hypothetical protein
VEVTVHIPAILPVRRKSAHPFINGALFDPKTGIGAQLQIERIIDARNFVGTVAERNLDHVQYNVRAGLHVQPEIVKRFAPALPAIRI